MSAAEHLQEAIDVGCTRDDHDHVADHRAEVLAEAADVAERFTERWPDMDAMKADGVIGPHTAFKRIADELRLMTGKDTGDAIQAPAGESTQPAPVRVWHVFDEDTAHATPRLYASEEAARLGTIARYEEMEGVCSDYSWRADDDVWELLAGGDPVGIYFAPVAVNGAAEDDAVYADVPDADEWVSCSRPHCPNGERYGKATERGWINHHMDTWRCPDHAARAAEGEVSRG